jgi:two-component system sensor histidine kinase KdpD
VTVNRQWHPLDEVLGSALNRLARELGDRKVHVDLPEDLPLAHFDDVLVEQLLINLLDNAAKYSEPGTPIEIRVEPQMGGVAVEISDRGRGLAAGDEERVFDMFFRGGDAMGDKRGSGLGLAICKGIATAHGGTIRAANRPGGGTTVRFTLPFDGKPPVVHVPGEERIRA